MSVRRLLEILAAVTGGLLMAAGCVAQPEQVVEGASDSDAAAAAQDEGPAIPVVRTAAEYLAALDKSQAEGSLFFFDLQMPDDEKDFVVQELRKRFPFESIRDRLAAVEQPRRLEQLGRLQPDRPPQVDESETLIDSYPGWRPMALGELHSDAAREFIRSPGFGFERMPRLSPYELERRRGPVVLNTQYHSATGFAGDEEIALGESGTSAAGGSFQMPAAETVAALHESGSSSFADREQNGLVRSRDEVAGFTGHAVDSIGSEPLGLELYSGLPQPKAGEGDLAERWHLNRVELVGLLASDEFRVYVSERLPAMDELKGVPTRRLDDFELAALPRLLQGETTHSAATPNRIRMLGALRASTQCLECHSVREGDLLGALSYELVRTPRVEVVAGGSE